MRTRCPVYTAAYDADATHLYTIAADGQLRVWATAAWYVERVTALQDAPSQVSVAAFSSDIFLVAIGGGTPQDDTPAAVRVWDTASGGLLLKTDELKNHVTGLAFSPDRVQIAMVRDYGHLYVWSLVDGKLLYAQDMPVESGGRARWNETYTPIVTYNRDGTLLASAHWETVYFWNAKDGTRLAAYPTRHRYVNNLTFSTDGRELYVSGLDGTVSIWEP